MIEIEQTPPKSQQRFGGVYYEGAMKSSALLKTTETILNKEG